MNEDKIEVLSFVVGAHNDNACVSVIAELGLAGIISGTLSYFAGIPPVMSFPVTVAAMSGQSIWEAIKAFAPNKDKKGQGD